MQAAHLGIEITQAGGQARDVTSTVESAFCTLDRRGQRPVEGHEPATGGAIGNKLEQGVLGRLDLQRSVQVGIGTERVVDDGFTDVDELPTQPGVVNGAAIFAIYRMVMNFVSPS